MKKFYYLIFILSVIISNHCFGQIVVNYADADKKIIIGKSIYALEDRNSNMTLEKVINLQSTFIRTNQEVPNFQISNSTFWIRIKIKNSSKDPYLLLDIEYPPLQNVTFFAPTQKGFIETKSGTSIPFRSRRIQSQNHLFALNLAIGSSATYYLKLSSNSLILVPIFIGSVTSIASSDISRSLINGLYFGIIIVMIFYNLFLYFSTKDRNYFFYVIYIFLVGLVQASLNELTFRYLWPNNIWLNLQSMTVLPALNGLAVVFFFKHFLDIKTQLSKRLIFLHIFNLLYVLSIVLSLFGYYKTSLYILQLVAIVGSFILFYISLELIKKGYRPAKFFLLAWSFFLSSIIIFVLRNFNLLPFNSFTEHVLLIGSGAEVTLLSFALADRINILKQEKEFSQAIALSEAQKNEHLIRDQNINLEHMVDDRTNQLTSTMNDLQLTMDNLKNTQAQLVDSEKMASLGQLTAGIAHEINNPINFVTSNIKPLKRDINDLYIMLSKFENSTALMDPALVTEINQLKEELDLDYVKSEIDLLLKGIDEGAFRTSEIIRGLKMFARVDEQDIKEVNLNEGFESTLLLLNSKIKDKIKLQMKLGAIPKIECYAGKLNQVFMNIISNSIYAINQLHGDSTAGMLCIETKTNEENDQEVVILIQDNGTGMPKEIKQKIFDPFFTTKPIGEGTGLGLSIVQQIIISHKGTIDVQSEAEKGTLFKIILPVRQ